MKKLPTFREQVLARQGDAHTAIRFEDHDVLAAILKLTTQDIVAADVIAAD